MRPRKKKSLQVGEVSCIGALPSVPFVGGVGEAVRERMVPGVVVIPTTKSNRVALVGENVITGLTGAGTASQAYCRYRSLMATRLRGAAASMS